MVLTQELMALLKEEYTKSSVKSVTDEVSQLLISATKELALNTPTSAVACNTSTRAMRWKRWTFLSLPHLPC